MSTASAVSPPPAWKTWSAAALALALALFTLAEVNLFWLKPHAQRAIFLGLGLAVCFLLKPLHPRWKHPVLDVLDALLALASLVVCGFLVTQVEPLFEGAWVDGRALGSRAGIYQPLDQVVAVLGVLLVLEAARRAIGLILPALALLFLAYGYAGPHLPDWLLPHRGFALVDLLSHSFLSEDQGVFAVPLRVMLVYVFLFLVFGAMLKAVGADAFLVQAAQRMFGASPGGPAKVAVISSGLMGSLNGSAVANVVTTGTFTIPLMKRSGFSSDDAAGLEAAASSGGALVPPVMGAGAYMMLELIQPNPPLTPPSLLDVLKAALLPAILYYGSLFLYVHFQAQRMSARKARSDAAATDSPTTELAEPSKAWLPMEGVLFLQAVISLLALLFYGFSPQRSATISLVLVWLTSLTHPRTRVGFYKLGETLVSGAREAMPLIAAAACVGILMGVITQTGMAGSLPNAIKPLAEKSLFLALILIMLASLLLGMGLPSVVCYILIATMFSGVLETLGVPILAAHYFIYYFGLLSMVTPPVALAAYAAASIAQTGIMSASVAAFRCALPAFTIPFLFVYRPALLFIAYDGGELSWLRVAEAFLMGSAGIFAYAAGLAGYFRTELNWQDRVLCFVCAAVFLAPMPTLDLGFWRMPFWEIATFVVFWFVIATKTAPGKPVSAA